MRPIDADALIESLADDYNIQDDWCVQHGIALSIGITRKTPTIDAVPVVRCKDCVHYSADEIGWCDFHSHFSEDGSWFEPDEDDFCSIGERRPT